ncbi:DUF1707 domain-containing protein [Nocardia brasiliensis]|uniref:DUF1707 SHOCT-like domain-containing protein n=1 Tax=Nocardia brasiliensis TaxID=37326 RepID=UPI00366AB4FE
MEGEINPDDLLLSDAERLHALNVVGEHFAAGRLDSTQFYDRSGEIAAARTLGSVRAAFRGLPGGVPLESVDGRIRTVPSAEHLPAVHDSALPATASAADAQAELSSLRRRGSMVESIDWVIIGITLMAFLILQFVANWSYAWVVWPSLVLTLSIPRVILRFSDADEKIYEELEEAETTARKQRLSQAAERIRELENKRDTGTD